MSGRLWNPCYSTRPDYVRQSVSHIFSISPILSSQPPLQQYSFQSSHVHRTQPPAASLWRLVFWPSIRSEQTQDSLHCATTGRELVWAFLVCLWIVCGRLFPGWRDSFYPKRSGPEEADLPHEQVSSLCKKQWDIQTLQPQDSGLHLPEHLLLLLGACYTWM